MANILGGELFTAVSAGSTLPLDAYLALPLEHPPVLLKCEGLYFAQK
jgi:hypothetical protein